MESKNKIAIAIIKNTSLYVITIITFFISVGKINVFEAWLCYILMLIGSILNNFILSKYSPELINSRANEGYDTKKWDKIILLIWFIISVLLMPCIIGLDKRFAWSNLNKIFMIIGIVIYLFSLVLSTYAMLVNKHFEGTVRIQKERNHNVIKTGPYKIIRHPGNLCFILGGFVQPLIIGSLYGLILSMVVMILFIIRTKNEDDLLIKELNGYSQYAMETKYRLIPKIW
jgi:protein-S-isoprenylcysteine O-methyltransferase Ste14